MRESERERDYQFLFVSAEENTSILSSLQLLLLEHSIMCHLIMGSKAQAIKEIAKVCRLLQDDTRQLQVCAEEEACACTGINRVFILLELFLKLHIIKFSYTFNMVFLLGILVFNRYSCNNIM